MRPSQQDDDVPVGLPASDGAPDDAPAGADLEPFEDDAPAETDGENVGLDAETGIDEPLDADLVLVTDGDEGRALLEGTEAAEDLPGSDGAEELSAGDEYGWTDGSEPDAGVLDELGDGLSTEEEAGVSEDQGEEGFDEGGLADLGLPSLRPLDRGSEEDEELEGEPEASSRRDAGAPRAPLSRLRESRVQLEILRHTGNPLRMLIAAGATGFGWDDGLLVASPGDPTVRRRGASASLSSVRAMAAMVAPWGHELILSTPEKLLRSADGGISLNEVSGFGAEPPSSVALSRRLDGGLRLLCALPEGELMASDDAGTSFSALAAQRVVRLASDGHSGIAALCRAPDASALLSVSHDAGQSADLFVAPASEPERIVDLQLAAGALAVAQRLRAPHLLVATEGEFQPLPASLCAPLLLLSERGELAVYAVLAQESGSLPRGPEQRSSTAREKSALARVKINGQAASEPEIVLELKPELGEVLQLTGAHQDGVTTLQIGTARAWLRVTVLPGGSDA